MKFIQAEMKRRENPPRAGDAGIYTMTWLPVDLKVKVGDILSDGQSNWDVTKLYSLIPEEREGGSPWKKRS